MLQLFHNWLSNEFRITLSCVILAGIALILNLAKVFRNMPFDIAWIAIILCGVPIVIGAIVGLIRDHDITADVLVSMALIASVVMKEWFAAGEVALIMQIGSLLEDFTANRARKGIDGLLKQMPQTARVNRNGKSMMIPVEDVAVGDTLSVIAGETIPVDGVILQGETSVDQSVMTGESIPVDKGVGDKVISGTINRFGTFSMRAEKENKDSSLQRMVKLAEEADAKKAPIVSLADKWAKWMVLIALLSSVLAYVVTKDIRRAVTVLVVFCPCAFVLATPTAVAAAIGNLTKYGVLVRTGDALERLSQVDTVAFDKTGTLTQGKPKVTHVISLNKDFSEEDILRFAAASEEKSEHPIGKAIVEYFQKSGEEIPAVDSTEVLAGFGIHSQMGSMDCIVGKPDLFKNKNIDISSGEKIAEKWKGEGATIVYISVNGKVAGMIALADTIRESSRKAVDTLNNLGITSILLTGDNTEAAKTIAEKVGVTEVRANLLPEDKQRAIQGELNDGKTVCMVGDGVNDALALSSAYAGIAMGGIGSDIAVESSDVVLVSKDMDRIPYLLKLSKKMMRKIRQNITISMILNFGAIILSFFGLLTPITGALWHNVGSVFVVVNAALLLISRDSKRKHHNKREKKKAGRANSTSGPSTFFINFSYDR